MNTFSIDITAANAEGSAITAVTRFAPANERIPPVRLSKRKWMQLPSHLRKYSKQSVEQALGITAFHDLLHANKVPHWVERRVDGVYMLWGEDQSNCALMPGVRMDDFPVGTRIEG